MKTFILRSFKTTAAVALTFGFSLLNSLGQPTWVTWEVSAGGNGHSYLAVPAFAGLTWNVADQLAQQQGGYLATINSSAENDFVFSLINSPQFFSGYNGSGPALGGYNAGTPSSPNWSWVTGEPWTFDNWAPGLPNYADFGSGPEDRLHYFSDVGSTPSKAWNDLHHDDPNIGGYVVETVPEPQAYTLLAAGIVALMCLKKLKARRYSVKGF